MLWREAFVMSSMVLDISILNGIAVKISERLLKSFEGNVTVKPILKIRYSDYAKIIMQTIKIHTITVCKEVFHQANESIYMLHMKAFICGNIIV